MKTSLETPISKAITVKLNMAMSLDGHTIMPSGSWPTSYKEDWRRMNRLRDWSDAVIVTRSTIEADNPNLFVRDKPNKRWQPQPVVLFQDTNRTLSRDFRVFQAPHPEPMLITIGANTKLEEGHSYSSWEELIQALEKQGMKKILLETGPAASGLFLERDLVDEVYLTLLPFALGGKTTDRPFITEHFLKEKRFKVKSVQRRLNLVFLRYTRSRKK